MKSRELSLIIAVIIVAAIFSVIVSNLIFSKSTSGTSVEVVPSITSYLPTPDSRYFNGNAIDPTQFISIGNSNNSNPFSSSSGQ